jgi:hypothetical protein
MVSPDLLALFVYKRRYHSNGGVSAVGALVRNAAA